MSVGLDMLGPLRLMRLRFILQAIEPVRLPPYKGSTLRGAVGVALKRTLCLRSDRPPQCDGCRLMQACRYPTLFETRFSPKRVGGQGVPPPPMVLIPPDGDGVEYREGDRLECGLNLLGEAVEDASAFVRAFAEVGRLGLGVRRGRFRLEGVESLAPKRLMEGALRHPGGFVELSGERIIAERSAWSGHRRWTLEFQTPIRLQSRGQLVKTAEFGTLIHRLSDRLESLSKLYGPGGRLDIPAILQAARQVRLLEADLRWDDWERYSNRQQTRMRLGGFRGRADYEGDLDAFKPLLALGEWLNVGKGAAFGLGRFRVVVPNADDDKPGGLAS